MEFKQNMKIYIGVVLILLLLIIFSQAKTFNFFLNTYLGRVFLILILLIASYCNKIFGVVIVLLIIIVFNNFNLTEGMENNDSSQTKSSKEEQTQINMNDIVSKNQQVETPIIDNPIESNQSNISTSAPETEGFEKKKKSIEGFDIIGTENSILRGKQSNSIHINQDSRTSKNVSGTDTASLFNNNYSNF